MPQIIDLVAATAAFECAREVAENVANAGVGEEQIRSELGPGSSRRLLLGLLCGEGWPRPSVWIDVGIGSKTLAAIVVGFGGVGFRRTVAGPVAGATTLVAASRDRATATHAAALIHSASMLKRKWEALNTRFLLVLVFGGRIWRGKHNNFFLCFFFFFY